MSIKFNVTQNTLHSEMKYILLGLGRIHEAVAFAKKADYRPALQESHCFYRTKNVKDDSFISLRFIRVVDM